MPDPTENAQSVSSYVTFGKFRIVHMGDLTYNKELDLMCPNNRLGTADLFIVSHHGQAISNSPALVHALQSARRHHQQRHAQGRTAGCDEGSLLVAGPRGSLADAFLAAERPGIHGARARSSRTRSISPSDGDADRRLDTAAAGAAGAAAAGAQRQGVLLQDRRAAGRHVHDHEHAQQLQQDVSARRVELDQLTTDCRGRQVAMTRMFIGSHWFELRCLARGACARAEPRRRNR